MKKLCCHFWPTTPIIVQVQVALPFPSFIRTAVRTSGTSLMNSGSSLATATLQYLRLCSWWKGGSTLAWHGKVVGFCGLERWFYHGMAWEGGWLLPMGLSFAVLQCPEKVITVTMQANISSLDTYHSEYMWNTLRTSGHWSLRHALPQACAHTH